MYAIKQATMTQSHLAEGSEQTIFYMDIRTPGKEYAPYYEQSKEKGLAYIKARPHTLLKGTDGNGATLEWVDETGTIHNEYYDMVVLSIGLEAPDDAKALAEKCGFELEGTIRKDYRNNAGQLVDLHYYGKLKSPS